MVSGGARCAAVKNELPADAEESLPLLVDVRHAEQKIALVPDPDALARVEADALSALVEAVEAELLRQFGADWRKSILVFRGEPTGPRGGE